MDSKVLNKRKSELLDQQTKLVQSALETKVKMTKAEDEQYEALSAEIEDLNTNIKRFDAIAMGKLQVGAPSTPAVIADAEKKSKFYAMGGYRKATELGDVNADYVKNFYSSLKSTSSHERFLIQNAALGETGSAAAGGALVPIETDPSIPNLQMEETIARSLSRVISTDMDINLPYQAVKTLAALKVESSSAGTNAFAENDPTFATTKLASYVIGGKVTASWELLEDVKAASAFIPPTSSVQSV